MDMPDVVARRDLVLHQRVFLRHAAVIVGDILGQRHTDALQDAALGLHPRKVRVDRCAAVNSRLIADDLRLAGFQIDLDLGRAHHERRGRDLRAVGHNCLQCRIAAALGGCGDLRQRGALRAVLACHGIARKDDCTLIKAQQPRTDLTDLLLELLGALLNRLAGDIGRAGCVGAGIVGRGIGVRAEDRHIVERAVQHLGGDLRQNRVAAGAHVGCTDREGIEPVIVDLQAGAAHIHTRNAGALHRHAHAHGAHLAVTHVAHGVFFVPADVVMHGLQAAVQRAAGVDLPVVGGHHIALMDDVALADHKRVDAQLVGQLIDGGLHRKQALGRTVAAVSARGHVVRVDDIADKAECLGLAVERDGFVAGQAHRCRPMLAVSTGVGQGVEVDAPDDAVLCRTKADMHLHLMARGGGDLALVPAEDDLAGLFGFPCHKGGVDLADRGLLGAEAAADAGLGHPDHRLGDVQRIGQDPAAVENDLGRAEDIQPPVGIYAAVGAEGLHHGLLAGAGVVCMVDDDIAPRQHRLNIARPALIVGAQVALVVGPDRCQRLPVFLRVDKDGVVQCRVVVQHGGQDLIPDLDELHRLIDAFFILAGQNCDNIPRKADMAVDDKPVIGARLRVGLARLGVAAALLVHILPCVDRLDARHQQGTARVDLLHDSVGMGGAQQLYDQAVLRDDIIQVDRLAGHKLHSVLFAHGLVHGFHWATSFPFFHAKKFKMPRSWPS